MHTFFPFSILTLVRLHPPSPHASSSWWNRAARRVIGNQYSYPTLETFLAWRKSDRDPSSTAKKLPLGARRSRALPRLTYEPSLSLFCIAPSDLPCFAPLSTEFHHQFLPSCTPPLREKAEIERKGERERRKGLGDRIWDEFFIFIDVIFSFSRAK